MVNGLEMFLEHFKGYESSYVLIGGTACSYCMEQAGLTFRSTKDIDMILIVEALDHTFVETFWNFIKQGGYQNKQKSIDKRIFYRFHSPTDNNYPFMIELFSRNPKNINLSAGQMLTPITIEDTNVSLSAILMDSDYYNMINTMKKIDNGISYIPPIFLIPMKVRAYLDLKIRKENGENIDSKNIKKHKNDIIRLSFLLTENDMIELPDVIHNDIKQFIQHITNDKPNIKSIAETMGVPVLSIDKIVSNLREIYNLEGQKKG